MITNCSVNFSEWMYNLKRTFGRSKLYSEASSTWKFKPDFSDSPEPSTSSQRLSDNLERNISRTRYKCIIFHSNSYRKLIFQKTILKNIFININTEFFACRLEDNTFYSDPLHPTEDPYEQVLQSPNNLR